MIACRNQAEVCDAFDTKVRATNDAGSIDPAANVYFKKARQGNLHQGSGNYQAAGKLAVRRKEIAHGHTVSVMFSGVDKGFYWIPPLLRRGSGGSIDAK
jgi:hypothetical protein